MRCGFCITAAVLLGLVAGAAGAETLDRGLVALEREDGSVFLSWRLLKSDPEDSVFWLRHPGAGSG
ncbi:MAG: rhamnogalacturonan endolyase family protein, partial [Planctomycetota bacterium]